MEYDKDQMDYEMAMGGNWNLNETSSEEGKSDKYEYEMASKEESAGSSNSMEGKSDQYEYEMSSKDKDMETSSGGKSEQYEYEMGKDNWAGMMSDLDKELGLRQFRQQMCNMDGDLLLQELAAIKGAEDIAKFVSTILFVYTFGNID